MRVRPNRLRKQQWVEAFRAEVTQFPAVILVNPQGITAREDFEIRRRLKAMQARYKVVKNRLAKLAFQGTPLEPLTAFLRGMTAVVYSEDGPALARTIRDLSREYTHLAFKAAVVEGHLFTTEQLTALVNLPTKDTARAQLLGTLHGPPAQFVRLILAPAQQLVQVLRQYQEKIQSNPPAQGGTSMAELTKEQVIEYLSNLTVTQLVELVKELEERWGVQAAAAVPVAVAPGAAAPGAAVEEEKEVKYSVVIKDAGQQKVQLIKKLREIFPDMGLRDAKKLVDAAPTTIKEDLSREEAESLKKQLEEVGATVEIETK